MRMQFMHSPSSAYKLLLFIYFIIFAVSPSLANESLSVSGRLDLLGVYELYKDSIEENASLTGKIKLDATA